MLFNSIEFAIFLPAVFLLYWYVFQKNLKLQNLFLIAVSYLFYGWWDWRFLSLIIIVSFATYYMGNWIYLTGSKRKQKLILYLGLIINLGILGFFKYYNFFIDSMNQLITGIGFTLNLKTLNIILPIGISFYIFHTIGYLIDVKRKKCEPSRDISAFFAYISFFPKLLTGPIEKATVFLPQFYRKREFNISLASDGMRQILWGLFKKMVIADNAAITVNYIFDHHTQLPASTLLIGIFYFTMQIYCDFSAYSDIAIGSARLFGFSLSRNFHYPYFSRDIAEFWRRWHITLFEWFREYVYLPVVWYFSRRMPKTHYYGIKTENFLYIFGILITFFLAGLWHGANWTFVVWGLLNGLYFLPLITVKKKRRRKTVVADGRILPSLKETWQVALTFLATMFAWIFFRSDSISVAFSYIDHLISMSIFSFPVQAALLKNMPFIMIMFTIEWIQRKREYGIEISFIHQRFFRWSIYYLLILFIILFEAQQQNFIYFQF